MHSLVQLLPQDLAHGIGAAVLCFLGSSMEIKHNTPRVRAQQIPNFCFNYLTMLGSPTPCTYHHARPEDCFFASQENKTSIQALLEKLHKTTIQVWVLCEWHVWHVSWRDISKWDVSRILMQRNPQALQRATVAMSTPPVKGVCETVSTSVCVSESASVCECKCVCVFVCESVRESASECVCVCVWVQVSVCVRERV